jgi:phosphotransferase system enzyme I (PtsI)
MRKLAGIQASPGIFIGTAYLFLDEEDFSIPNYSIMEKDLALELQRFNLARARAETELTELRDKANAEMGSEHAAIFDSHILMLNDVELLEQVETSLERSLKNVEWILFQIEQSMVKRMGESNDSYLAERAADIKDVSRRVIGHLLKRERRSLSSLEGNLALVARNLLPSETSHEPRRGQGHRPGRRRQDFPHGHPGAGLPHTGRPGPPGNHQVREGRRRDHR